VRRVGHALPRGARRRRVAHGPPAEPGDVLDGRAAPARQQGAARLEEGARVRGGGPMTGRPTPPSHPTPSPTHRRSQMQRTRLLKVATAGALVALLAAACGGSSGSTGGG